ncbi:ribosome hibernation-promoting factor, HPF/YfiA family [Alkalithermobacter paradoxus]|uniref:Ribosome hibernation promoting factor n=1 Tax=Alkalithermobacter paradoxus TaxID=29349 RepID=A0A1V4I8U0_9FIRM|nr:putative sigma-54 modulation protein [[Clostridium] thermoalcaliphilum]
MDIKIVGKNIDLTEGIKTSIQDKLGKLGKYFTNEVEIRATVRAKKARQTIEVTVIPISGSILRAEQSEENLYAAIDGVVDKLSRQLRKYKTRLIDKGHQSIRFENISDEPEVKDDNDIRIMRRKKFGFKPMSEEEAILQMELLGHNFFVFTNAETDELAIVYKRKEGDYGIIEPE